MTEDALGSVAADDFGPLYPKVTQQTLNRLVVEPPHPWRRYFARMFDYTVIGTAGMYVLAITLGVISPNAVRLFVKLITNPIGSSLVAVGISIPVMATLYAAFGTTPGKAIFGIRVMDADLNRLTFKTGVSRELNVWIFGMCFGIPLLSLWALTKAHHTLK